MRQLSLLFCCAKTELAATNDATNHGFVFVNTFNIFALHFERTPRVATAARMVVGSQMHHKKQGVDFEADVAERLAKYDPLLHDRIRAKMAEKPGILLEETVSKADYVSEPVDGWNHWGTFGLVEYFKGLGFELF